MGRRRSRHGNQCHAAFGKLFVECNGSGGISAVMVYLTEIHRGHTDAVFQGHIADFDGREQVRIVGIHEKDSFQIGTDAQTGQPPAACASAKGNHSGKMKMLKKDMRLKKEE